MKIAYHYINDLKGNPHAVQLPIADWEKILGKLKSYEEAYRFSSDIKEAYEQIELTRTTKANQQTLNDFLDEL